MAKRGKQSVPAFEWQDDASGKGHPVAVYGETGVDRYDRDPNPFIMALPAVMDEDEVSRRMTNIVEATDAQRAKPGYLRQHELEAVEEFFQPLEEHLDLHQRISVMLRAGYVGRNPVRAAYVRELGAVVRELEGLAKGEEPRAPPKSGKTGRSLTLLGLSGVGKSSAVTAIMATYPQQVIYHPGLKGPFQSMLQLVWLHVACPEEASLRGLLVAVLLAFDRQLGTDYHGLYATDRASTSALRVAVARLAFLHGLGLLVIDEVQHLNHAKSGDAGIMIDFFKALSDVMQVPLLVVGTEEAEDILGGNFQAARRHSGLPLFAPMPLYSVGEDGKPVISPYFRFFCDGLFKAQFLRKPITPDDEMLKNLHFMSTGIRALVVKLFALTQLRALSLGAETLTPELFRSVFEDCFKPLHRYLDMMRGRSSKKHEGWSAAFEGFIKDGDALKEKASAPGEHCTPPSPVSGAPADGKPPKRPGKAGRKGAAASGQDLQLPDPEKVEEDWKMVPMLVRTVADGAAGKGGPRTGYESLREAGYVRALGAEVLAGWSGAGRPAMDARS